MTSDLINKIDQKSKIEKFKASKNYKPHGRACVPYEELVVLSPIHPDFIFLVHKNMIFERNSVCDSSYDVYSFNKQGELVKKEDVSELGKEFFHTMKVVKKL